MLDKLKAAMGFKKKPQETEKPKAKAKKTPKEIANAKGEAYVAVLGMDIDADDINNGAFELQVNETTQNFEYKV